MNFNPFWRVLKWIAVAASLALMFAAVPTNSAIAETENGPSGSGQTDEETSDKPKRWYKNIVPIPVIITEPAVGEGLGLGIGYFHPAKSPKTTQFDSIENPNTVLDKSLAPKPPPVVTGIFGGATNNGTWAAGVGHMNTFRDDSIRYLGVAGYASVITDFYVLDRPFEFNLEGVVIYQEVKFRLARSNWFLGIGASYLDATNTFKIKPPEPNDVEIEPFLATDFKDIGVKGRLMYESRDDSMMPGRGRLFDLSLTEYDDALGGDYEYTTLEAKLLSFHPLHERFVLGLRGEYSTVDGSPPFYAVPWVTLRGVPAMRFQGRDVLVAEVEGRFSFNQNWAMVAFYGRGWTDVYNSDLETEEKIRAYGVGGRFRALKDQGVWVGLDLAKGPEDTVYYIQVGHPW
jgi:hypothetical protein